VQWFTVGPVTAIPVFDSHWTPIVCFSLHGFVVSHGTDVLDSYVELRRRSVFACFFAAWPELKARVLTSPGHFWHSCDRWVLSRVAFTVAEV
jgi:hypothetical protein